MRLMDRIRQRIHGGKIAVYTLGSILAVGLVAVIVMQTGAFVKDRAQATAAETNLGAAIQVTLKLEDTQPSEEIVLLVNGTEKIPFNQEKISLSVQNGALIEVDGRKHDKAFSVIIDSVTDEGVLLHDATEIKVNKSIETVGRALIKMN